MKKITFTNPTAQKMYNDYLKRVSRCIKLLSDADQYEMLMEINSHIYEATHMVAPENEIDVLMDTLEKLGTPEETLQPAVAYKKTQQAVRSFNPRHIVQALYLNISNGIGYSVLMAIYLLVAALGILVVMKLIYPSHTGLFMKNGHFFAFGFTTNVPAGNNELLGNWFILAVIGLMFVFYLLNTLIFRLLKKG